MCIWVCVPVLSLLRVKLVEGTKLLLFGDEDCKEGCSINEQGTETAEVEGCLFQGCLFGNSNNRAQKVACFLGM